MNCLSQLASERTIAVGPLTGLPPIAKDRAVITDPVKPDNDAFVLWPLPGR